MPQRDLRGRKQTTIEVLGRVLRQITAVGVRFSTVIARISPLSPDRSYVPLEVIVFVPPQHSPDDDSSDQSSRKSNVHVPSALNRMSRLVPDPVAPRQGVLYARPSL